MLDGLVFGNKCDRLSGISEKDMLGKEAYFLPVFKLAFSLTLFGGREIDLGSVFVFIIFVHII